MQKFKILSTSLSGTNNRVLKYGMIVTEKDLVSNNIKGLEKSLAIAKCDKNGKLLTPLKGKAKADADAKAKKEAEAAAKAEAKAKADADAKAKKEADK